MERLRLAVVLVAICCAGNSKAEEVAKVETKGVVFKNSLAVEAFDDTSMGVTCYVTKAKRAMSLDHPSDVALSCVRLEAERNPPTRADNIFAASKSVLFKQLRIDRFHDEKRNVLIYLAYTKDLAGKNAAHAISVVSLR